MRSYAKVIKFIILPRSYANILRSHVSKEQSLIPKLVNVKILFVSKAKGMMKIPVNVSPWIKVEAM